MIQPRRGEAILSGGLEGDGVLYRQWLLQTKLKWPFSPFNVNIASPNGLPRKWHDSCYLLCTDVYIHEMAVGQKGRAAGCVPIPTCGGFADGHVATGCKVLCTKDLRPRGDPRQRPIFAIAAKIAAKGRRRQCIAAAKMTAAGHRYATASERDSSVSSSLPPVLNVPKTTSNTAASR